MKAAMSVVLSLVCLLGNVCAQELQDKKYNHAHVLQDLESPQNPQNTKLGSYYQQGTQTAVPGAYQNPNTGSYAQNPTGALTQTPNSGSYQNTGSYSQNPTGALTQTPNSGSYQNTGSYAQNPNTGTLTQTPNSGSYQNTGSYAQNPNTGSIAQNPNSVSYQNQNAGSYSQNPNTGAIAQNPNSGLHTAPSDYSQNPYLPQTAQPAPAPTLQPERLTPAPQGVGPVVHAPLTPNNNNYNYNNPAEVPVGSDGNILGPHIYAARASQYTGPQVTWAELRTGPVIILVQDPESLSYDMAYASSGLSNLYRDKNSQLIARLLLSHSDKVGVIYPTSGFPLASFPDFPIGSLILPQDMGLKKMFNFYPRYTPILFLYSPALYQKISRDTPLSHLGQWTYE